MPKRIDASLKEIAKSMLRSGATTWRTAEATGISESTIAKIRKELRIDEGWDLVHKPGKISRYIKR